MGPPLLRCYSTPPAGTLHVSFLHACHFRWCGGVGVRGGGGSSGGCLALISCSQVLFLAPGVIGKRSSYCLVRRVRVWNSALASLLIPFSKIFPYAAPFSFISVVISISSNNKRDFSDSWRYLATLVQGSPLKSYVRYLLGIFLVAGAATAGHAPAPATGHLRLLRPLAPIGRPQRRQRQLLPVYKHCQHRPASQAFRPLLRSAIIGGLRPPRPLWLSLGSAQVLPGPLLRAESESLLR